MLLTDDEISGLSLSAVTVKDALSDVLEIEAAILAKLASAELPEPVVIDRHESGIVIRGYTAAQLHEAHAQGFAAGAAAQLSAEPVAFTDADFMSIFVSKDIAQDCGATIELYTRREA